MKKKLIVFVFIISLLLYLGCAKKEAVVPDTLADLKYAGEFSSSFILSAQITPEPVEFSIATPTPAATITPPPTPVPTPTPEPTPVPTPSPIPFSYYAPTVAMSFDELVGGLSDTFYEDKGGEEILPQGYPEAGTYKLIVDEYWQVVMAYKKDGNGEYTVPVRYMLCSSGSKKLSLTRKGTFKLEACRIRYGKFAAKKLYAQYWSLVFSRTYFHSILYTDRNDFKSLDLTSYRGLGTQQSHGCIRLTVPDARWIYYNCAYGTEVVIREGSKNDGATGAIKAQLKLPEVPENWPYDIKLEDVPYTDNWRIGDVKLDVPYVKQTPRPAPKS